MIILGIDPGQKGALCWLGDGKIIQVSDIPTMPKLTGKGTTINHISLAAIIANAPFPDKVFIEKVHAMPKQGVSSVFEFGYGVGLLHGILAALHYSTELVTPNAWKKYHSLLKKPKDASRSLALTLYPQYEDQLNLKKHNGRADAICIALYGSNKEKGKL